jgi:hypothetical protein
MIGPLFGVAETESVNGLGRNVSSPAGLRRPRGKGPPYKAVAIACAFFFSSACTQIDAVTAAEAYPRISLTVSRSASNPSHPSGGGRSGTWVRFGLKRQPSYPAPDSVIFTWSLRSAVFWICRIRSRVRLSFLPISSSVIACPE